MAKKRTFSAAERWAVYTVHGEKCYLDGHPIDLQSMQVDHIIPESLINDPDRLSRILHDFGLPSDFDLNSYENWLPACPKHNNAKRSRVFAPTPLIQLHLQRAAEKGWLAREVEAESVSSARLAKALNEIERAAVHANLDPSLYEPLIENLLKIRRVNADRLVLKLSLPSLKIFRVLSSNFVPTLGILSAVSTFFVGEEAILFSAWVFGVYLLANLLPINMKQEDVNSISAIRLTPTLVISGVSATVIMSRARK